MFIKWLGHSSFLITSQDGKKIITDPFHNGHGLNYNPLDESADIVTSSHEHGDHNNVKAIKGNPIILTDPGNNTLKGIDIKAIPAFHDETGGSQRGNDLIFCFKVDGMNLCHMGDLGHQLNQQQISQIGPVEILFIPVGGFFTINAQQASMVAQAIKPRSIFPMHYKTPKTEYPISGIDEFLKNKKNVRRINSAEIEIKKESLPSETEIIVLQSAN
jgi:L-ascorbate metabolism protein UlaG (beta-lactamase superfamily)